MQRWSFIFLLFLGLGCAGLTEIGTSTDEGSSGSSDDSEGGSSEGSSDGSSDDGSTTGPSAGPPSPPAEIPAVPDLPTKIAAAVASLVPDIDETGVSSQLRATKFRALTGGYQSSADWQELLEEDDGDYMANIFGPVDISKGINRIRNLNVYVRDLIQAIVDDDPEFICDGADALSEGDLLDIAFFDDLDNGTSDDRKFDCIVEWADAGMVFLYGRSGANSDVYHIVTMGDYINPTPNPTTSATRGDRFNRKEVFSITYSEATATNEVTEAFIDYRYAQAMTYEGADKNFDGTADNILYKTHSRITGDVLFNGSDIVTEATGDFNVIKFDSGLDGANVRFDSILQTMGRGGYGVGDYSLIHVDHNDTSLAGTEGFYCVQNPQSGNPAYAGTANCTAFEEDYAWGDASFPFALVPDIAQVFESNALYETTDLIATDGSDFTIPTY
ncbi:MAG: hypothetical protein Q7T11_06580 [Deltaproteobacteria bacterium]|nr:hypothetical protein [Deltaproteobacteria bacterium]